MCNFRRHNRIQLPGQDRPTLGLGQIRTVPEIRPTRRRAQADHLRARTSQADQLRRGQRRGRIVADVRRKGVRAIDNIFPNRTLPD